MTDETNYWRYWGKAGASTEDKALVAWHPLAYHALDVAACGQVLLRHWPHWLRKIAHSAGIEPTALSRWLVFLLAIHDSGKFADGFQALRPDLQTTLQARTPQVAYDLRHDTLGYAVLMEALPVRLGRDPEDDWELDLLQPWIAAVTGHHGRPPLNKPTKAILARHFLPPVRADLDRFVQDVGALLSPDWCLPQPAPGVAEYQWQASWLVAGLAVVSDWLGSNRAWFDYRAPDLALDAYWHQVALPVAERAVRESGLGSPRIADALGFSTLFYHLADCGTPLQSWADTVAIARNPQLFILEELTGGGKTEAALTLVGRLLAAGQGSGVYFALPTMATADAMRDRLCQVRADDTRPLWQALFANDDASLILAHSAAATTAKLDALRRRDAGYDDRHETPSASQDSSAWLADSRKKALLADFGIGTIDQALLSVLPLKHQSLRLLGLATKVLLVDEVHACDCYLGELLQRLLHFHAALGGSAILLSATLPIRQRERLLAAFAAGAGYTVPIPEGTDYPLASHLHAGGLDETSIPPRQSVSRPVWIDPIGDEESVFSRLAHTVAAGGCAVWIRNTVTDAIDVWRQWNLANPGMPAILFHARFVLGDRLNIATLIQRSFGPDSNGRQRGGRLVIATQVVEQSLDVDFDEMVTDLAPIDLIVQRAGRLHRHARDASGNRAERELRGAARLGVLMPEAAADAAADWFAGFLEKAARVYPDHGKLWLTARWLHERRCFDLATDARDLIESVYGEDGYARTPEALRNVTNIAEGQCQADRGVARLNLLRFDEGYHPNSQTWPEEDERVDITTRLGEKTVRLRLVKYVDGGQPGAWIDADPSVAWALSELTIPQRLVAAESARHAPLLERARMTMPDEGRYCLLVLLEPAGEEWQGWAMNKQQQDIRLIYSSVAGLRVATGEVVDESDL